EALGRVEAATLDDTLRHFVQERKPGDMRLVRGEINEKKLRKLAYLSFEVGLFRIRGTNDWLAICGTEDRVAVPEPIPLYLFDVLVHNHIYKGHTVPSAKDLQ